MSKLSFQTQIHVPDIPLIIYKCIKGESTLIGFYNDTRVEIISYEAKFVSEFFHHSSVTVHPLVTGIFIVLLSSIAVYTISVHAMLIIFHNHKPIKAASFAISHFIFSGCYLILLEVCIFIFVFSHSWPTKDLEQYQERDIVISILCNNIVWCNSIGTSLILTRLCGNWWRIYRIFTYFKTKHHLISDSTLNAFIIVVVGIILVVLVLWTVLDPLMVEFEQQGIEYNGKDDAIILVRSSCHSKYFTLWTAATHSIVFLVYTQASNTHLKPSWDYL